MRKCTEQWKEGPLTYAECFARDWKVKGFASWPMRSFANATKAVALPLYHVVMLPCDPAEQERSLQSYPSARISGTNSVSYTRCQSTLWGCCITPLPFRESTIIS